MPTEFAFSQARLADLAPPAKGRAYYRDTKVPGLQLAVTASGSKVYYFRRWIDGTQHRIKIARLGEVSLAKARERATELAGEVAGGKNPQAARRVKRSAVTVQDLFDHWIAHAKLHKRTWKDDQRQFNKYTGLLKKRKLGEVTTGDVTKWHRKIGEQHGPYQANRVRALLSAMFNVAREVGFEGRNPCLGVKRFKESERERFLQPNEIRPLFAALAEEPPIWRDFWLVCLFSGARRGNVAAMAWKDLNLDDGLWHLPGKETKGGVPIVVVLAPPAVIVLRARREETNGRPWVFAVKTASGHVADPRKSWARVMKRSGLQDLRPHDLRRSLGSWQATAGASLQIIGASLGHRDPKATSIYSRLQIDPVRKSVDGAVASMLEAAGGLLPGPKSRE